MDQSSDDRTENPLESPESVDGRTIAGAQRPHDTHGRFTHVDEPHPLQPPHIPLSSNKIPGVEIHKTSDDNTLVDVHVNNPLHKVVQLLEDIKKQKAFSFDIKGSLGVAGIFLVLTTFGIFGGTRAFCSKGEHSHIGRVVVLTMVEEQSEPALVERMVNAWNVLMNPTTPTPPTIPTHKVVLVQSDKAVYHLIGIPVETVKAILNQQSIVTGEVDACSQTIKVEDSSSIQPYQE
jgi:hypothetical protein